MDLNYFKDKLFNIINESEEMDICNITANDHTNLFTISIADGSVFEIECKRA